MRFALVIGFLALAVPAQSQWTLLDSHSTADFRGVVSIGKGIVWVSGTNGTVLRSEDGGHLWQHCAVPPGAEKLDFRGIQAFDANTAIVMSSGKGDLSRLYKTTDGCQTWKLVFTNPDKDGFWDALRFDTEKTGALIGDPVRKGYPFFCSNDGGNSWEICTYFHGFPAGGQNPPTDGLFAASNSSMISLDNPLQDGTFMFVFGTGGKGSRLTVVEGFNKPIPLLGGRTMETFVPLPLAVGESSGPFSLGIENSRKPGTLIAVGGDYQSPDKSDGTAAACTWHDDALSSRFSCKAAQTLPHGYRSAVAYDEASKTWITVGPNGTDISTDDGRNWRALKPGTNDPPDADKNWNALSLPFVVGPHGRIGVLIPSAVKLNGAALSQP